MPRSGPNGTYTLPGAQATQVAGTPIPSAVNNQGYSDIEQTFNTVQPVPYGGTGVADGKPLDNTFGVKNSTDPTKIGVFSAANIPAGQTRTYDLPYYSGTLGAQALGAPIASASTVNLAVATGSIVHITGAATITSFGTSAAGVVYTIIFDGALTLAYNATSMILPGGANIATAAGDAAVFVSEGSGNWRMVSYQRAGPVWETIVRTSAITAQSLITIPSLDEYRTVQIDITVSPSTDGVSFDLITSADNGASFATSSGDYRYTQNRVIGISTVSGNGSVTDGFVRISPTLIGNGTGEGLTVRLTLYDFNKALHTRMQGEASGINVNGDPFSSTLMGHRYASQALNAFRIYVSSGTFTGYYTLQGIKG